jgi:hypothetical protein
MHSTQNWVQYGAGFEPPPSHIISARASLTGCNLGGKPGRDGRDSIAPRGRGKGGGQQVLRETSFPVLRDHPGLKRREEQRSGNASEDSPDHQGSHVGNMFQNIDDNLPRKIRIVSLRKGPIRVDMHGYLQHAIHDATKSPPPAIDEYSEESTKHRRRQETGQEQGANVHIVGLKKM